VLPGQQDASVAVAAVVPIAQATGTASRLGKVQPDGTRPTIDGAWRQTAQIVDNSSLRIHAVAATPLLDHYGDPVGGLLQLQLIARTLAGQNRCSGPNVFQIGPNLINTIITTA
jgi:hypothetical protein